MVRVFTHKDEEISVFNSKDNKTTVEKSDNIKCIIEEQLHIPKKEYRMEISNQPILCYEYRKFNKGFDIFDKFEIVIIC